jgi:hypothetical protein
MDLFSVFLNGESTGYAPCADNNKKTTSIIINLAQHPMQRMSGLTEAIEKMMVKAGLVFVK